MTAPARKPTSPLRGFALGLLICVILSTPIRHLVGTWLGIAGGVAAGVVVAVFILSFATTRR